MRFSPCRRCQPRLPLARYLAIVRIVLDEEDEDGGGDGGKISGAEEGYEAENSAGNLGSRESIDLIITGKSRSRRVVP